MNLFLSAAALLTLLWGTQRNSRGTGTLRELTEVKVREVRVRGL